MTFNPSDQEAFDENELHRLQKRRAIWAIVIVAVFSAILLGSVQVMYYFAGQEAQRETSNEFVWQCEELIAGRMEEAIDGAEEFSEAYYVLLIGSDSRKGTALYTGKGSDHSQNDQYADVITLMRVDPVCLKITLVTVPRDTVLAGSKEKINAGLRTNDPKIVVKSVEKLTGVHIDYYLMTNFIAFEDLVDSIGGVTVDVPARITVTDPANAQTVIVEPGKRQHLNGSQALVLARARKEYGENQDQVRQENVRNLEIAIMEKALSNYDAKTLSNALFILDDNVVTNMSRAQMSDFLMRFMGHADDVTYYSCAGPFEGGMNEDGQWVIEEDKEAWANLMAVVDAGMDPNGVLPTSESH